MGEGRNVVGSAFNFPSPQLLHSPSHTHTHSLSLSFFDSIPFPLHQLQLILDTMRFTAFALLTTAALVAAQSQVNQPLTTNNAQSACESPFVGLNPILLSQVSSVGSNSEGSSPLTPSNAEPSSPCFSQLILFFPFLMYY